MSLHQAAQTPQSQPQAVRRRRTRPSRLQAQANAGAGPTKKYKIPTIDAERARMYEPTFAGTGAPEWNEAVCTSSVEVLPGVRLVTLEVEVSREIVPLAGAYTGVGRRAKVKVGGNPERLVTIASAPFPTGTGGSPRDTRLPGVDTAQRGVLLKLRHDIFSGALKTAEEAVTIKAPLELWVGAKEAPELAGLEVGERCTLGYYEGHGLELRALLGVFRFPVLLIFAQGRGVATAKALVEAAPGAGLSLPSREDVRLYVQAPIDAELPFAHLYAAWEAASRIKVRPAVLTPAPGSAAVRGGVREAFDEDDVEYDPALTGAVVLGDEAFEKEVLELLEDAGVPREAIVLGSVEAKATEYLRAVKFAAAE